MGIKKAYNQLLDSWEPYVDLLGEEFDRVCHEIYCVYERIARFFYQLYVFIPIFWRIQPWDSSSLYDVLLAQMKILRDSHALYDMHLDKDQKVAEMDYCLDLGYKTRDRELSELNYETYRKNYEEFWANFVHKHEGWWH